MCLRLDGLTANELFEVHGTTAAMTYRGTNQDTNLTTDI